MSLAEVEHSTGHNVVAKEQLRAIVERIEHVEGEIKDLQGNKGEIYQEAKSNGYDVKILRKVIALRRMDPSTRSEQESIMEAYIHALGMTI